MPGGTCCGVELHLAGPSRPGGRGRSSPAGGPVVKAEQGDVGAQTATELISIPIAHKEKHWGNHLNYSYF